MNLQRSTEVADDANTSKRKSSTKTFKQIAMERFNIRFSKIVYFNKMYINVFRSSFY